ncbi:MULTISPECIES: CIA30 family protein [unclassified Microbulbifer]|uniref:CIA30 family protein n=1 Tax=unclassified Microbulbifer TaxID=2619833 RepID=UPI0027E3EE71|nr:MULTISPECIES: CIA30 family protein [unclassified Microbulbifer]
MTTFNSLNRLVSRTLATIAVIAIINPAVGDEALQTVDDFSDSQRNSLGIERQFIDDTTAGGNTAVHYSIEDGILVARGEIAPPRGQPGWASAVLLLDPQGLPINVSKFQGVRLLVRVNKGNLSISAISPEVTNFDYHAAPIALQADGQFHEVKIPFASMKRAWSEQTPLNTETISSLSMVAFDVRRNAFDFEVDEVSFY